MNKDFHRKTTDDDDTNALLNHLLLRLEAIIHDVKNATDGKPYFIVEARLKQALETEMPGITFTAADISAWAADFSS